MTGRPPDGGPLAGPSQLLAGQPLADPSHAGALLADRLRRHLQAIGTPATGSRVVVAVSGGLDSMVLLHLLRFPLRDLELRLDVAHLDHAMRPGSAADAHWVRGVCRAWGLPYHHHRLDPPARSEADARDRRYRFLHDVAAALDAAGEGDAPAHPSVASDPSVATDRTWITTGHHRDDQAETVLFRAIRGTGPRGLRGIAPRRGRVVRPLLGFRRWDLEAYARSVGMRHRVDPTNRDLSLARNRIRHHVLPALEAARPGAAESLARLAERARGTERAWQAALERLEDEVVVRRDADGVALARSVLQSYHPALRARVLRHLLRRWGTAPDRAGTDAALEFISSGPSGGEVHLPGGVRLERDFDEIRIRRIRRIRGVAPARPPDEGVTIPDAGPGRARARIGGRWIEVAWGADGVVPPVTGAGEVRAEGVGRAGRGETDRHVTLREPVFPLTLRGWAPGDRIRFAYGSKKLKDLFREKRLDRHERRAAPVLADGAGSVLWVAGVARAEGVSEDGVGFHIAVVDAG